MIRNLSGQTIGAQMINASTGAAFAGSVTVFITLDGGTQTQGTVNSGLCTLEGNGYYTYAPTAAETNGALVAATFVGTGAVPQTIQYDTILSLQAASAGVASASAVTVKPVDLVTFAWKRLGIYKSGETLAPADLQDGFTLLNTLMDALGIRRLTINGFQQFDLPVVAGHNPYTVGLGQDFNQVRPSWLEVVTVTLNGTTPTTIPVQPLTQEEYANLAAKTVRSQIPTNWYYNPTLDIVTPAGGLYFWPIPNDASITINVWCPVAITQFATPYTVYALLPGWRQFLETGLAIEIASMNGVTVPPTVYTAYAAAQQFVKAVNVNPAKLAVDRGLLKSGNQQGFGNWLSGP